MAQAISADGVVPFLGPLAKMSKNGEPRRALMVTTVLSFAFSMMGSLDIVAPLVSICFLTCYSALNLSCLVLSAVNAPRSVHHHHQELIFHTEFFHCFYFGFGKHVGANQELNLNFFPNVILLQTLGRNSWKLMLRSIRFIHL